LLVSSVVATFVVGQKQRFFFYRFFAIGRSRLFCNLKRQLSTYEDLFDLGTYSLFSDFQGMFLNGRDPEVIFFRQFVGIQGPRINFQLGYYTPSGGHNIEEWRLPNGNAGWSQENPLMNLVDEIETLSGEILVVGYTEE
jgi:hypothetical protein